MDTAKKPEVLGLDFEDTLWRSGPGSGFDGDALPAVLRLSRERFGKNIWVVSMCGVAAEDYVRSALEDGLRLWQQLGLGWSQVRFCRRHEEKAEICRELGVTHFIDDRPNVLVPMEGIVPIRIEMILPGLSQKHPAISRRDILRANGWAHVLRMLLPAPE